MRIFNVTLPMICSGVGMGGLILSAANESVAWILFCGFWSLMWQRELHRDLDELRNGE